MSTHPAITLVIPIIVYQSLPNIFFTIHLIFFTLHIFNRKILSYKQWDARGSHPDPP